MSSLAPAVKSKRRLAGCHQQKKRLVDFRVGALVITELPLLATRLDTPSGSQGKRCKENATTLVGIFRHVRYAKSKYKTDDHYEDGDDWLVRDRGDCGSEGRTQA